MGFRFAYRLATGLILPGVLVLGAARAWAVGEIITDIRVQDNVRTAEDTIRSISGLSIGEELQMETLEIVRERLNTSGLFADVNVFWEPYKSGVRVYIIIKEKFPWAPVPTFSYSKGNTSAGGVIAHGNLFGRGKRGIIGGRISTADSGALLVYDDPAFVGSWVFWNIRGKFQEQVIPEFSNRTDIPDFPVDPIRETKLRSFGGQANLGVAWFRKVKTSFGWNLENYKFRFSKEGSNPYAPAGLPDA